MDVLKIVYMNKKRLCYLCVQDFGTVLWTHSSGVPFFSSPYCSDSCVFIGAVNGHIVAISHSGNQVRVKKQHLPWESKSEITDYLIYIGQFTS